MKRKKWTAREEVTESLVQFREKRKWQIALRRYVLEKNKSSFYAPYFGLEIEKFREWIQIQFDESCSWDNFPTAWQLDHIVPVAYFDFTDDNDLRLCWNFTNISVEKTHSDKDKSQRIDLLAAKTHFSLLFEETGYGICKDMVDKLSRIEASQIAGNVKMQEFLKENKDHLENLKAFTSYEFEKLNTGSDLKSVLFEKEFLKKFST